MSTRHINVLESEKHTPKGFPSSPTFGFATKDENGNSTYQEPNTLPSCLAFVDGNAVPPTTNNGDIYVLIDEGNGTVNTDWEGASYNDFVRFSSGVWVAFNPFNGVTIFNKADNLYYLYNSGWSVFVPEVPTLYTQNGSIPETTNREVTIPSDSSLDLLGRVGIGKTPNTSAILDASVNDKGVLLPLVNNAQMSAISSPADYLKVFNTEEKGEYFYNPTLTAWDRVSKNLGNSDLTLTANRTFDLDGHTLTFLNTATSNGASLKVNPTSAVLVDRNTTGGSLLVQQSGTNKLLLGSNSDYWNVDEIWLGGTDSLSSSAVRIRKSQKDVSFCKSDGSIPHLISPSVVEFFRQGFSGSDEFIVGSTTKISNEKISLQAKVLMNNNVMMTGLPTSSVGLSVGELWNDSGTIKIVI